MSGASTSNTTKATSKKKKESENDDERWSLLEKKIENVERSHLEKIEFLEEKLQALEYSILPPRREEDVLVRANGNDEEEFYNEHAPEKEAGPGEHYFLPRANGNDEEEFYHEPAPEKEAGPGEHYFLPPDIYSYLACSKYFETRPFRCGYSLPLPSQIFSIAMLVCAIQVMTLGIFLSDVIDLNDRNNPIGVPADVTIEVSVSQLIALLISCFCQDEVRASFNVLNLGYYPQQVRQISHSTSRFKWYFSIYVRIALGVLNLIVTFILIVNSMTVRDVMLDFAAVTFVSELDNGAFTVAKWGYFGPNLKNFTAKIKETPVYDKTLKAEKQKRSKFYTIPRLVLLALIVLIMFVSWATLKIRQIYGAYVDDTIFVQFGDDFSPSLGAFSGLYELATRHGNLRSYLSREIGPYPAGISKFFYCELDKSWVFQYGDNDGAQLLAENGCWSRARSSRTLSYDIVDSASELWYVYDDESSLDMPLQPFYVSGEPNYYGKQCEEDDKDPCGDRLRCDNGKCVCKEDTSGLLCQFPKPCEKLELDERDANGFTGTRMWSRTYHIMKQQQNTPILVYGKPIYIGEDQQVEGVYDVMMFTGRRWILTDSNWMQVSDKTGTRINATTKQEYAQFLSDNFHAYWSNYTFFFTTEAVDVGKPTDSATPLGLQWYRLDTASDDTRLGFDFKSKDAKQIWKSKTRIEATLFCIVCNTVTNPCYYGAICSDEDGTCECSTGSQGKLCQIPPDGNGLCDVFFNTPEFSYDGGDCCIETCTSSEEHVCGDGIIKNDAGVSARTRIGFPNCADPRFKSKISGSVTLYEIVERGTVRCGFVLAAGYFELHDGVYSGFEAELCNAIGAAVSGDPHAVEYIPLQPSERFRALQNGKIDVLFWTTYTAERDVYESTAKVGFSFTSSPHFYDGVKFGGVPTFVNCADNVDFESAECVDIKICAPTDTSWLQRTKELFPDRFIAVVNSMDDQFEAFRTGLCNVIVGESNAIAEVVVREAGFSGPAYAVGKKAFSKEPLAPVTRKDDRVWSKFVSWVIQALIQAEAAGITQATAERLAPTDVFGEQFRYMFKHAVAANGNYGEIYEKTLERIVPRAGLSQQFTEFSSLIYSFPFGNYEIRGPPPITGGTIETIRKRGVLNCGVNRKFGFAKLDTQTMTWRGVDVDICRGIAAALFNGSPNVNFIPLINTQRFATLAAGSVDVLSCTTTYTLTREVKEPVTGEGFDFSPPYFYDGLSFGGIATHVKCADAFAFGRTTTNKECTATRICVNEGTTWLDSLRGPLNVKDEHIVVTEGKAVSYEKFILGECNVIAGETADLIEEAVRDIGYTGEYYVGIGKHTREPLAVVSRSDDIQFSDFVRWVIFGFFYAAEERITKETYYNLPATNFLFGDYLSAMWQHAVEASGNYEEILKRNFGEASYATKGLNTVNDGSDPLFYPLPGIMFD